LALDRINKKHLQGISLPEIQSLLSIINFHRIKLVLRSQSGSLIQLDLADKTLLEKYGLKVLERVEGLRNRELLAGRVIGLDGERLWVLLDGNEGISYWLISSRAELRKWKIRSIPDDGSVHPLLARQLENSYPALLEAISMFPEIGIAALEEKNDEDQCERCMTLTAKWLPDHFAKKVAEFYADDAGTTPLSIAAEEGWAEIVKLLVDHAADVNKANNNQASPLYFAAQNGHEVVVETLLVANANVNQLRNDGNSPLLTASERGHTEVVRLLLENKANINQPYSDGASPLYIAAQEQCEEIVNLLLENNADVNKACKDGATPLYIASQVGNVNIVKKLLEGKADPNARFHEGTTPLFIAAAKGHKAVVEYLLAYGASDKIRRTADNKRPSTIAREQGYDDIAWLIRDYKAPRRMYGLYAPKTMPASADKGERKVTTNEFRI